MNRRCSVRCGGSEDFFAPFRFATDDELGSHETPFRDILNSQQDGVSSLQVARNFTILAQECNRFDGKPGLVRGGEILPDVDGSVPFAEFAFIKIGFNRF